MFGSTALEVAIGLAFLFFILSLVASAIREIIEGLVQSRAAHLERGIRELLRDTSVSPGGGAPTGDSITADLYNHPLVNGLFRGTFDTGSEINNKRWWRRLFNRSGSRLPAYIPARNFALALLDLSARGPAAAAAADENETAMTFEHVRAGLSEHIGNLEIRRSVLVALDAAKGDLEQARINLEAWYDSGMDRVSGWYRKSTQWILLWIGLILAMSLNIDTAHIATYLYQNDAERSAIVAEAEALVARGNPQAGTFDERLLKALNCPPPVQVDAGARPGVSCAQAKIQELGFPMGWKDQIVIWPWQTGFGEGFLDWLGRLPGWLLTALAITLGAPFWFDLLNKIMVIRSTVKPHEKSPEESSEDRQRGPRTAAGPAPAPAPAANPAAPAAPAPGPEADDPDFTPHRWQPAIHSNPQEGIL
jgi:hypothetical protein